ncbi:MAG: ABC-F family ATP-binding cassette domain-containing protein, partial [Planctomycetaceae bacterium]|nr:ABC-F family ATP-binding cassette domain-containing protein [Planctomycetaceae bacterium]
MILLAARDLCRQFDADPVFREVTFDVRAGEKIALVGPNGCGKSSLMRVLAGQDDPDVGSVERPSTVTLSILDQHATFAPGRTLIEEVKSGLAHLYKLQDDAQRLAEQMATATGKDLERLHDRYDKLHSELERLDAYEVDHRVEEVLHGLGFTDDQYERPLSTFSGGQQNRASLCRLLLAAPDVLLLDEPTNHLDIAATEWLEEFLARSNQAVIVVSHDRMFLDRVTNRTLELWQGGITDYPGNFSFYWEQRDERLKVLRRTYEKQVEFVEKTKDFIARNKYGQKSAQAKDRVKKLERVELVELPQDFSEVRMGFPSPSRTGDWVIRTEEISKGFPSGKVAPGREGSPDQPSTPNHSLFTDLTLQIDRGDRVGILGPNGSGKTTLLRTLLGELKPDRGDVKFGTGVSLAYFDQQLTSVDPSLDAIEAVRDPQPRFSGDAPYALGRGIELTPGTVRGLLARFGITGDLALAQVGDMSGGERTKVALTRMYALEPNVMFLDEPTNHLDLWACAALERSLREFEGTVLFVSHDRYFIDHVATKVLVFEQDCWRIHEGNYTDYQQFLKAVAESRAAKANNGPAKSGKSAATTSSKSESGGGKSAEGSPRSAPPPRGASSNDHQTARRKRKFPFRKLEEIEADIARAEQAIARFEADLADPAVHRDGHR